MSMSKAKAENRPLPKRFYETVSVAASEEGWRILLDGRPVKTPARAVLAAPCESLAEAIAAEWGAQEKEINPFTMPLTRLASLAVDRMGEVRAAAAAEIAKYARTDLLCYRSETPDLAERQRRIWDPYLDWAASALDAPLNSAETVLPVEQPEASIAALETRALALDNWRLTGLASAVPLTGSAILGFALLEGEGTGEAIFQACRLDEDYQTERWGEDAEAGEAAANRKRDLLGCEQLFRLLDEAGVA